MVMSTKIPGVFNFSGFFFEILKYTKWSVTNQAHKN